MSESRRCPCCGQLIVPAPEPGKAVLSARAKGGAVTEMDVVRAFALGWFSWPHFSEQIGASQRTAQRVIDKAIAAGLVKHRGAGTTASYALTDAGRNLLAKP